MELQNAIENLGFSSGEAKVYLALLQAGSATGYELAKATGLKQPTVYLLLEELRKRDAVLKVPQGKRHVFSPKDPRTLINEAKARLSDSMRMLPNILALTNSANKPKILYFDGESSYHEALKYLMDRFEGKEIVGFFANMKDEPDPRAVRELREMSHKLSVGGTQWRGIMPKPSGAWLKQYMKYYVDLYKWNVRFVSNSIFDSNVSIVMCEDVVHIASLQFKQCIVFENKDIAGTMKNIFEIQWKSLEIVENERESTKRKKKSLSRV